MLIKSLKAGIAALNEAMKEKGVPTKVVTTMKETSTGLQKLLDKAREAAKAAQEAEGKTYSEEEAEAEGEEEEGAVEPGHTMTVTHKKTVKHDGPKDEGEEAEDGKGEDDEKDEKDSAESKRGYIKSLLIEAKVPEKLWSLDRLCKMSLAEAKAEIKDKQALIEEVRKSHETEFVPTGEGQSLHESDTNGAKNLNGMFAGLAE